MKSARPKTELEKHALRLQRLYRKIGKSVPLKQLMRNLMRRGRRLAKKFPELLQPWRWN